MVNSALNPIVNWKQNNVFIAPITKAKCTDQVPDLTSSRLLGITSVQKQTVCIIIWLGLGPARHQILERRSWVCPLVQLSRCPLIKLSPVSSSKTVQPYSSSMVYRKKLSFTKLVEWLELQDMGMPDFFPVLSENGLINPLSGPLKPVVPGFVWETCPAINNRHY